jgi:hypothetical protein
METKPINLLYDLFYKIFTSLSKISSFFNNLVSTYCTIFILVTITLLGLVLFANNASISPKVDNLIDTKADLERRTNDNTIPLDLAYVPNGEFGHFLIDKKDSTGLRMKALFINRTTSFKVIGNRGGFIISTAHARPNNQGELLVNADLMTFNAVNQYRGVLTRGIAIDTNKHHSLPNGLTVLKV